MKNGKVKKTNSNTSIDLGGIAKGHCVDKLLERINEAGYSDVFVDWGSEIRAVGQVSSNIQSFVISKHPDNRPWRIAVMEPPSISDMFTRWKNETNQPLTDRLATMNVRNQAIATSGDYMQVIGCLELLFIFSQRSLDIFTSFIQRQKKHYKLVFIQ